MKRNILIPLIFIIYLGTVAYFTYPYFVAENNLKEFFAIIGLNIVVLLLLHLLLRRRDKQRHELKKKKQAAQHRNLRNDKIW